MNETFISFPVFKQQSPIIKYLRYIHTLSVTLIFNVNAIWFDLFPFLNVFFAATPLLPIISAQINLVSI